MRIVDLAQDFRDESEGFVYGLPELNRDRIRAARRVANPGCFATAIQLALLPLAREGLLREEVHATAVTGSTGAGGETFGHDPFQLADGQHLGLQGLHAPAPLGDRPHARRDAGGAAPEINFVPMRGDFARGILASVYTDCDLRQEEAEALYRDFYADAAFTFVADRPIDLKQAVNTNKAVVQVAKYGRKLHIVSAIDNLLKGASGQAVQNMNLLFGLDEREGLRLKASAF